MSRRSDLRAPWDGELAVHPPRWREVAEHAPFPLRLEARSPDAPPDAVPAWLARHREPLEAALRRTGAIVFRGFPVPDARAFDAFVRATGLPDFPYARSLSNAVRVEVTERVFTANEAPPSAVIRLHHEMAQTPFHPDRLFFFCETPAARGGATSLCRSDHLLAALAERRPRLVRDCETKGLRYTNVMPDRDDPASGLGRSWRRTFGARSREDAERRLRELGYTWRWLPDGCLRATSPVLPAVRRLDDGSRSFFNQLIAALAWQDERNEAATAVTFGDGTPIDPEDAAAAGEIAEALAVDLDWRRGDVAWVDNHRVLHGRRGFEPPRRVLASLAAAAPLPSASW